MATYKGILSFPSLFVPKVAKGATDPKFSCTILMPATDPQVAVIQQEVQNAKLNTFPSGYTGSDECFGLYDEKYAGKEYYDPRFSGWYVLSVSAKADDKPAVVDMQRQPVVDGNEACSGAVVYLSCGISGYVKGKGGIGGWLNGVMVTPEPMPFGRLDGKPSVDQMFADVGGNPATGGHVPSTPTPPAPAPAPAPAPTAPPPPAPPAPPVPAAAPQYVMTAKAAGATREQFLDDPAWSDELLIQHGYMLPPNGVTPSFA